jgi:polar amino acid transport system substrate-binding protein
MPLRLMLAVLALLTVACSAENATIPPLRVGCEAAYPPFESKTPGGEIVGFDVDLMHALGQHLGRPVEMRHMEFDTLLFKLGRGDLDMVCSGLSYTEERAQAVTFSEPYVRVPMAVLVHREKAGDVTRPQQLDRAGVVIAVQRGTTGAVKAGKSFPQAELRLFDTEVDAANELILGRVDAFVYDIVSVHKWHEKEPGATRILEQDLGSEDYCIALPKGSDLVGDVNAFLAAAKAPGGVLDTISERWLGEQERALYQR